MQLLNAYKLLFTIYLIHILKINMEKDTHLILVARGNDATTAERWNVFRPSSLDKSAHAWESE